MSREALVWCLDLNCSDKGTSRAMSLAELPRCELRFAAPVFMAGVFSLAKTSE